MDERWCYEMLRRYRWRDGVACVHCGSRRITVHTRSGSGTKLKYLCLECRRIFTDLTATVFARSNLPLSRWFLGLALLSQGLSTREYARAVSVKWDTARRMSRSLIVAASEVGLVSELRALLDARAGTHIGQR